MNRNFPGSSTFFASTLFWQFKKRDLRHAEAAELKAESRRRCRSARVRGACHRDFHSANLIVDEKNRLRIIDHQDARLGPVTYDLVHFLLDRRPEPPSLAELRAYRLLLLEERRLLGLGGVGSG